MKVYVVMYYNYDDTIIASIWSTKERADAAAKIDNDAHKARMETVAPGRRPSGSFDVDEYEVKE